MTWAPGRLTLGNEPLHWEEIYDKIPVEETQEPQTTACTEFSADRLAAVSLAVMGHLERGSLKLPHTAWGRDEMSLLGASQLQI